MPNVSLSVSLFLLCVIELIRVISLTCVFVICLTGVTWWPVYIVFVGSLWGFVCLFVCVLLWLYFWFWISAISGLNKSSALWRETPLCCSGILPASSHWQYLTPNRKQLKMCKVHILWLCKSPGLWRTWPFRGEKTKQALTWLISHVDILSFFSSKSLSAEENLRIRWDLPGNVVVSAVVVCSETERSIFPGLIVLMMILYSVFRTKQFLG